MAQSARNVGDLGSIPRPGKSPGKGHGNLTPVFLPEESHGRRSLVGYSPWGHKESDMTEQLHFHFHSSGHRTGKGQFSFQSQRKAMPKNAQTTAQLHSSHMLVK